MPAIQYQEFKFKDRTLRVIAQANKILEEYAAQGFNLTLRQLYYQFVARALIENSQREYKNLGSAINDGRLAGLIDWNMIIDRTRNLTGLSHWNSPSDIIRSAAASFRLDKWETQPIRPEIWVEKDAAIGIVENVAVELDVPYFSCRGYTSQSEMWSAAMRLLGYKRGGQTPYVLHIGDHDPSGKDMSRDIKERLEYFGVRVKFKRLALNMDQVEEYQPPPNPAKVTDSRFETYVQEFGEESWELDALEPSVVVELIREAIMDVRDERAWAVVSEVQDTHRENLQLAAERWSDVEAFLQEEE